MRAETSAGASATTEDLERLRRLENEAVYVLREAHCLFPKLAMLWSMGKDSTLMLWLARRAFFGTVPFPVVHIDTSYKIPEMIRFRDQMAREWGLDLRIGSNRAALQAGMCHESGRLECCTALKTEALRAFLREQDLQAVLAAIRRDEEGSRGKERIFSPRGQGSVWNYKEQPPELWSDYQTEFPPGTEVRIHPLLNWTELDIWLYTRERKIPTLGLYYAREGRRYRSVGCAPCTATVESEAATIDEIIAELRATKVGERSGRAQDQADRYAMQKLRAKGYM